MKNRKQHTITVAAMLVGGLFSQNALSVNNPTSDVSNDNVSVNNAIWDGNFTISNLNQAYTVGLSNSAQWNGNLINLGANNTNISVDLRGSSWNGVMTGSATGSYLQMTIADGSVGVGSISWAGDYSSANIQLLNNSQLTGDVSLGDDTSIGSNGVVSATGNSLFRGNYIATARDSANGSLQFTDASQWYGDVQVHALASPTAPAGSGTYAFSNVMLNAASSWEGNLSVDNDGEAGGSHASISAFDRAAWTGNADVRSGGFAAASVSIGDNSRWDGNINVASLEGAMTSINVVGNSLWNGRVDLSADITGNFNAALHNNSTWNGDHIIRFAPATDNGMAAGYYGLMMGDKSSYNGNGTVSGNISNAFINLFLQSVWNGGLDLTQASLSEYGMMMVDIRDGSRWRGFLNGPALATVTVDQSEWVVTGNTAIKELNIANSSLGFGDADNHPAGFHTLTIAGNMNVTGSVPLSMRTNMEAYQGDLLVFQGDVNTENNAPLKVTVNNQGGANITDFDRELTIVQTQGSGQIELTNDVEVGAFLYRLKHDGNEWRLYAASVPMLPLGPALPYTPVAEAALDTMNASYLLSYGEMQTLTQRLGDLRVGRASNGAWARAFGGRFDIAGRGNLPNGFDMKYGGLQAGTDRKLDLPNGGTLLLGAMFGAAQSNHDYARGDGQIVSTHAGVYGTYEHPQGFYADAVIKYNHMRHEDKPIDTRGERQSARASTNGFSGSLEIGKRFHLSGQDESSSRNKEGWYVEPQLQVMASRQGSADLNYSNGLRSHFDAVNSLIGRAGVQAGYELKTGDNPISLYAKVSYVREFDGDVNVRFNNVDRLERFRGNWISSGIGVNAVLDKRHSVYADLESNNGNLFNSLQFNVGYRFSF